MNIEKIEKLFRLATKNPNKNEAMVAATKFIEAVARENLSVQLYKGQKPASQQEIQQAIDNAYKQGIQAVKNQYQQELDRQINASYNEGYLDGKRQGYSLQDVQDSFNKGYKQGKDSVAIEKSQSSEITADKVVDYRLTSNTSTIGCISFHNGSSTIRINRQ